MSCGRPVRKVRDEQVAMWLDEVENGVLVWGCQSSCLRYGGVGDGGEIVAIEDRRIWLLRVLLAGGGADEALMHACVAKRQAHFIVVPFCMVGKNVADAMFREGGGEGRT